MKDVGTSIITYASLELTDASAWSAPSAIGSAGLGLGGQLGAEMTDFLIVLNSTSVGLHVFRTRRPH
jgi:lipid-binding SYLF domain-containing protein